MANDAGDFERAIDGYNGAYDKGSAEWFSYFAADATVFPIDGTSPIKGRDAYAEQFRDLLSEQRSVDVLQQDVQVSGDTAVAMQLVQVTQSDIVTIFRESTIWRRGDDGWAIIHLDTSRAAPPIPTANALEAMRAPENIRVLSTRLATASSQVGVAQ